MENERNTSMLLKFYKYFNNSPSFKKASKFTWCSEPASSAPMIFLLASLVTSSVALIFELKGINTISEKYIGILYSIFWVSTLTIGMVIQIFKLVFVDEPICCAFNYNDVLLLKEELEQLIFKIVNKRQASGKTRWEFVGYDYKVNIDAIAALLYTIDRKSFFHGLCDYLISFKNATKIDFPLSTEYHNWKLEDFQNFVRHLVFLDLNVIDGYEPVSCDYNENGENDKEKIIMSYMQIVKNSERLKENCISHLVDDWFDYKDVACSEHDEILINRPIFLIAAGIDKKLDEAIDKREKKEKLKIQKNSINWI